MAIDVGQSVKFAEPSGTDEAGERFVVRELRGDRVLVEFICDMHIKPTYVYLLTDLVEDLSESTTAKVGMEMTRQRT